MIFRLAPDNYDFPPPHLAEEDGLLAVEGDLSEQRLLNAYQQGIFPWYSSDTPILWYSPHDRFVLFPEKVKISKSMQQVIRSGKFSITENRAFAKVIKACADMKRSGQEGTWILDEMQEAFTHLHHIGVAHSIEVWQEEKLAGGLYGVRVNNVFCGESMFSNVSNASKTALIWLCQHKNYSLIDCQVHTDHLESMGAEFISREAYMTILRGH